MKCKTFRNKINNYFENEMSYDMKKAFEVHKKNCESCMNIYIDENKINQDFKLYFSMDNLEFKSSRSEILNSIDNKKYSSSITNKMKYNMFKYKSKYLGLAATLLFLIILGPRIINNIMPKMGSSIKYSKSYDMDKAESVVDESLEDTENNNNITKSYYFNKSILGKDEIAEFNNLYEEGDFSTAFEISPNGEYSMCVNGKGNESQEEGYASIILIENEDNLYYKLEFPIDDEVYKDITPKKLIWIDNENVLIIIGFPYGTVTQGGDVYKYNINDDYVTPFYLTGDDKREVEDIELQGDMLHLTINKYIDANYLDFEKEELDISIK
ncbi:MAG: DUF4652 domain-containing protein [Clostridiaceae bacterium]